ncbi:MAG: LysM peptidoglycan-binding domain-containing protein [Pseudomonadota bacterium]
MMQIGAACRRLPYIMIVVLILSLGACAPRSQVGGGTGPTVGQEPSQDVKTGGQDFKGGESTSSLGPLDLEKDADVVVPTEVLDLTLPSKYQDGKALTDAERKALLTVTDLDRVLSVADYEMIMPYFSFYVHKSRVTIKHMVKNASPYLPYIRKTFRENGIPEELAYLGMIESVYRPSAVSHAGAAGVWQFMPGTGRAYGLQQDWWIDERRDVYKATHAAVNYLKVLYNYFGDWLLVVTAYNAGEGTVLRALKETNTDNFFDLARKSTSRNARLKLESQRYAPSFLAVTKIMRSLEDLGFDDFDKDAPQLVAVKVPAGTDLLALTEAIGISWDDFTQRNAAFRRYVSPPDSASTVYLDADTSQAAMAFLAKPRKTYAGWTSYKIKKGDTLGGISKRCGVPVSVLCRVNNVSPKRLRIGSTIMIPSKAGADLHAGLARDSAQSGRQKNQKKQEKQPMPRHEAPHFTGETRDYIVKKGDTLYDIAHAHDLGWKVLMEANNLTSKSSLRIGQHLKIPVKAKDGESGLTLAQSLSTSKDATTPLTASKKEQPQAKGPATKKDTVVTQDYVAHVVKKGETLYSIARKYGTDVETIMKNNGISDPRAVGINRCLNIPITSSMPKSAGTYVVQSGDTIWSIAKGLNMSTTALLERNGLTEQSVLRPGDVLNITRN